MKYGSEMALNQTDIACQSTCNPEFQCCRAESKSCSLDSESCHPELVSGSALLVKCKQMLNQVQHDTIE